MVQRGYEPGLKNAAKYLREGVACFADALGLKSTIDAWKFCLTRNFGDYDQCVGDFQRTRIIIYEITSLNGVIRTSFSFSLSNFCFFDFETIGMESAVGTKMKQLQAEAADPQMVSIASTCTKVVSGLQLTPQKDFVATLACVTPKYCPALYRELDACYRANDKSTRSCRQEVINIFACANDFEFRRSERFFSYVDGLQLRDMPHPSAAPTSSGRYGNPRPQM